MEEGRHPYTQINNEDYDEKGIPRGNPPPYTTSTSVVASQATQTTPLIDYFDPHPPSYMWLSIISCCFCWPMAICALIISHESGHAAITGDYATARKKGHEAFAIAMSAIIIGIFIGIIIGVTYVIVRVKYSDFF